MRKFFIVFVIYLSYGQLHSFVPRQRDFVNDYQYQMHQSWLKHGNFKANIPATFSEETIEKTFTNESGKEITVEYLWERWKIYEQREKVALFCEFPVEELVPQLSYLESFIYRLNCREDFFVLDMIDEKVFLYLYHDFEQKQAVQALITDFRNQRFEVKTISLNSRGNRLGFIVTNTDDISFELYFPESADVASLIKEMRLIEEIKAQELIKLIEKESERLQEIESLKEKVAEWQKEAETTVKDKPVSLPKRITSFEIVGFIRDNYQKLQTRELLHNKIDNSEQFIYQEFRGRKIEKNGDQFIISQPPFLEQFSSNIKVKTKTTKDGIDIVPVSDYTINGKKIQLATGDSIDLERLTQEEIINIAPYLCQLLYGHRAMGTRLLNFLLIHDDVPTSLILYGEERELFEMYSYANMILLLHKYWQDRTVYFILDDFKKVNDYIEFTGFMVARSDQSSTYDFAEIRYQLSHDYRIHLAMMILHPEVEIIETN